MLVQFASHARARRHDADVHNDIGLPDNDHLLAMLASARRWFNVAAIAVVAVVMPGGFVLFREEAAQSGISFLHPLGNAHRRASLLPNDCPVRLRSKGAATYAECNECGSRRQSSLPLAFRRRFRWSVA